LVFISDNLLLLEA